MHSTVRAALISTVLILPFVVLELKNQPNAFTKFPYVLFVVVWLVPFLFTLILPGVVPARSASGARGYATTAFRGLLLIFLAVFWTGLVLDQMPCFLGVPNCD